MSYAVSLPYTKIEIPPRGSFPAKIQYAPLVTTLLYHKGERSPFLFPSVVDSGADFCVFPAQFGEMMGIDIEKGEHLPTFGVGGGETIFFHKIKVGIVIKDEVWDFECYAGFSKKMSSKGVGLLGRDGFFDLFQEVSFNQGAKMFRLKGEGARPRQAGKALFDESD